MSEFVSELKASWLGVRQNEFHQSTRGIMTPEERQALEDEFDRKLAAHDRETAAKALEEHAWEAYEAYLTDPELSWPSQPSQSAMHFKSSADKLRRRAQEYRSGETDN